MEREASLNHEGFHEVYCACSTRSGSVAVAKDANTGRNRDGGKQTGISSCCTTMLVLHALPKLYYRRKVCMSVHCRRWEQTGGIQSQTVPRTPTQFPCLTPSLLSSRPPSLVSRTSSRPPSTQTLWYVCTVTQYGTMCTARRLFVYFTNLCLIIFCL